MSEDNDAKADKYYQVIGERIAIRRKALKMTQEELSKQVNRGRVTISNIEVGRHMPDIPTLYSIAKALKTDIHGLLPKDICEIDEQADRITIRNLEAARTEKRMKGLTVGRIVHFVGVGPQHAAALVTRVLDAEKGIVNLTVFADMEEPYVRCEVPYEQVAASAHSWHWIEQV